MDINSEQQPSQEFKHLAFYHCFFDLPMNEDDLPVFIDHSCINGIKVEGRKKLDNDFRHTVMSNGNHDEAPERKHEQTLISTVI